MAKLLALTGQSLGQTNGMNSQIYEINRVGFVRFRTVWNELIYEAD